jgi:hypothetical protein
MSGPDRRMARRVTAERRKTPRMSLESTDRRFHDSLYGKMHRLLAVLQVVIWALSSPFPKLLWVASRGALVHPAWSESFGCNGCRSVETKSGRAYFCTGRARTRGNLRKGSEVRSQAKYSPPKSGSRTREKKKCMERLHMNGNRKGDIVE